MKIKKKKQEIEETENKVLQERHYVLDACIVKIIKEKKTILHNELIESVFANLKLPISVIYNKTFLLIDLFFVLKSGEIKKRIESLIERDFICRDKKDINLYNYIA